MTRARDLSAGSTASQTGNSGKYLTTDGSATSWGAVSAGGMTLLSTTTLTGASVTMSSISSSYNNLILQIVNYLPATDGAALWMRINGVTSTSYFTREPASLNSESLTWEYSYWDIALAQDNGTTNSNINVQIPAYAQSGTWKMQTVQSITNYNANPARFSYAQYQNYANVTAAISSITLLPSSGNFTSGTALLYGVK